MQEWLLSEESKDEIFGSTTMLELLTAGHQSSQKSYPL
jgi:hypothetical protein